MPFPILPLAIGAGSALLGELTKRRPSIEGFQFPQYDIAGASQRLSSGIGTDVTAAGRSAGKQLAGMGIGDSSVNLAAGRGIAGQGMQAFSQGFGQLQDIKQSADWHRAMMEFKRRMMLDQQPDFWNKLGGGAQIASSLYPMLYPQLFAGNFNQGGNEIYSQQMQGLFKSGQAMPFSWDK